MSRLEKRIIPFAMERDLILFVFYLGLGCFGFFYIYSSDKAEHKETDEIRVFLTPTCLWD